MTQNEIRKRAKRGKHRRRVASEAFIRVHLYNVGDGPADAKYRDMARFVAAGATVILGQEFGDQIPLVARFLKTHRTWRVLWEPELGNNGRKTPIFYDAAVLELLWWDQRVAWKRSYLGPQGAGPSSGETKRLNAARFRVRANGVVFRVQNHHLVPSAFRVTGLERVRRIAAWVKQAAAFFADVRGAAVPVIGGGDWNGEKDNPVLRRLVPKRWAWDTQGVTHKGRQIDLLGHTRDLRVRVIVAGTVETHGSRHRDDHKSSWVIYGIAKPSDVRALRKRRRRAKKNGPAKK